MNPCNTDWQRKWLRLDVYAPEIQEMATAAQQLASNWFHARAESKKLLVLVGETGVGKTLCAKALLDWARSGVAHLAWERRHWRDVIPSASFYRWPEIADKFKEGQYGVLQDLFDTTLIGLDDVGAEHDPSRNAADKLCQVLSRRQDRLWTVITTNVAPAEWPTRFDKRIADRLMRSSVVVDLSHVESYSLRREAA
jgi:DNA replication protein DnaC